VRNRILAFLLCAVFATGGLLLTDSAAVAHRDPGPCAIPRGIGESVERYSEREIACAVGRFGPVPGGARRAICIARRESGLVPGVASRPKGLYVGLYQHLAAAWPSRYEEYTSAMWQLPLSAFSGRTNAIVTIRMVKASGRWKAAGWPVRACR
jgi:hypothetical protein